jgi:hypothetical protein
VSYIAAIFDATGNVTGVLIGHTELATNPFTQPVMSSLNNLSEIQGQGMLLDEYGRILYHPNPDLLMKVYTGRVGQTPLFMMRHLRTGCVIWSITSRPKVLPGRWYCRFLPETPNNWH